MVKSSRGKNTRFRSLAIVSGKGGSGKTLVASTLAQLLASEGRRVILIDADLGTGGLTYYLGFSAFERAREGLTEYLRRGSSVAPRIARPKSDISVANPAMSRVSLLSIGEHKPSIRSEIDLDAASISKLNDRFKMDFDVAIYDCRGGLDQDSIAVCAASDDILVIAETDAAAIQASQYLTNMLYDAGLGQKISGFILNKAMDDPTVLAKAGISFFRSEYLGSIPFDIETTRSFIKWELPDVSSLFSRHVGAAVLPVFGVYGLNQKYKILSPKDFGELSLKNPVEEKGSFVILSLFVYFTAAFVYVYWRELFILKGARVVGSSNIVVFGILANLTYFSLVIAALSSRARQYLGLILTSYTNLVRQVLRR